MKKMISASLILYALLPLLLIGQNESVDLDMVYKIKQEGMKNSNIEELAFWLTDYAGPRLSASKGGDRGYEIAKKKMEEFGLQNVRIEFARDFKAGGWDNNKTYVAMTAPYYVYFAANPVAWTGSTKGTVKAEVVPINIKNDSDFEKYRGKLKGKVVLLVDENIYALYSRARISETPYSDEDLKELSLAEMPNEEREPMLHKALAPSGKEIDDFLQGENAAVILRLSKASAYNITRSTGVPYKSGDAEPIPELNLPLEAFGRMDRLLRHNISVEMEIEIKNTFTKNPCVYNVIGEIPGSDPVLKDEIVLIGAHIDSWHGGTGAVDNAAGCIVMMEAIRILKKLEVTPRRTIRIALWGGEEQGLNGSRGYVERYLVDPQTKEQKPGYDKFVAYYNSDHLTGKIRGIYLQENDQVRPIFEKWLSPFADMGCTTLSIRNFWNTDHISFDEVNLPGFTFIQDQGEHSNIYHTAMDTYERLLINDLKQNAVIVASLAYNTAMRDQKLPGKPITK